MEYVETCGVFGANIKCEDKTCGEQFSNGCMACSNPKVIKYFHGKCKDISWIIIM